MSGKSPNLSLFSAFLIIVILLCACERKDTDTFIVSDNGIAADETAQSSPQSDRIDFSEREDVRHTTDNLKDTPENLLNSDSIIFQVTDDFDNDGNCETFAFDGDTTLDGDSSYGSLLYAANGKIEIVYEDAVYEDIFVFDVGDGTKYLCLRVNEGHNKSLIYGVEKGLPKAAVISDIGERFTILSNDEFTIEHSALDGISLGGGHTVKPYYFYYDHGFHEYGATEISVEEFMGYDNASEYLSYVKDKGGEIESVLRRNNHIIHINYTCDIPDALQSVQQNLNLTLSEKDNILTLAEENDGVYIDAMIPEIAVF